MSTEQTNPALRVRAILSSHEAFASSLLCLFLDAAADEAKDGRGFDPLHWHPKVIRDFMERRFSLQLPQVNFDKLMAGICVVATDLFFDKVSRFATLVEVLAGNEFRSEEAAHPDALEIAWAVTEALLLHPPDDEEPEPFSDDVRRYIGKILREEGYVKPPDILAIALGGDASAHVHYNFGDDPGLLREISAAQQEKANAVTKTIRSGMEALLLQLKSLPLKHGSATELEKRLSKALNAAV